MSEKSINYHCTEGNSDKVYRLSLVAEGDGFLVTTQYGPRGGRQTVGEKTKGVPVPLETAEKIFAKEHKARLAKGYRVTDEGAAQLVGDTTRPGEEKEDSGIRPQLLNPIERHEVEPYLRDDAWLMQLKWDGERVLILVDDGEVRGINRKGQFRPLPVELVSVVGDLAITGKTVLDGELIGTTYCAFDLLEHEGRCLRHLPTEERAARLLALIGPLPNPIVRTQSALSTDAKRAMLAQAEADGEEGVVLKLKAAPFGAGRPSSGGPALKLKFTESASVRVAGHNLGKRSIAVEVVDGTGRWIGVGNCTIPANYPFPEVGAICELTYLYYTGLGGALFQPVYRGERTDIDASDCQLSQLKHKGQGKAAA